MLERETPGTGEGRTREKDTGWDISSAAAKQQKFSECMKKRRAIVESESEEEASGGVETNVVNTPELSLVL
jgi:hypothetical protein